VLSRPPRATRRAARPAKTDAAYRARRAADTRRCRARQRKCRALFPFESDDQTIDLAIKFAGLDPGQLGDRQVVGDALARLLRLALAALLREQTRRR
jgi:hypothetical protein